MLDRLLSSTRAQIATVKSVLLTSDILRTMIAGGRIVTDPSQPRDACAPDPIGSVAPAPTEWRIYDHCSAVTRLYAVYEGFVNRVVAEWLRLCPKVWTRYDDIPEKIRLAHRFGVAHLLQSLSKARYAALTDRQVLSGYYTGLTQQTGYELLPEAFVASDQNLRSSVLTELLARIGMNDGWNWIKAHPSMESFIAEVRGGQNTADSELTEFVQYRNEAAHGSVDNVLSTEQLIERAEFIENLCGAVAEFALWSGVGVCRGQGKCEELGVVTETFASGAVVAVMKETTINRGEQLVAFGDHSCFPIRVNSIHVEDVPADVVAAGDRMEVGFMFDRRLRRRITLLRVPIMFAAPDDTPEPTPR
jgi:hypothetical protein